ncbi:MAG: hypothetical protein LBU34_01620 [Planctomycetaceae bacterium]|nr:hypothetical protein [Planctomycetaceae bacterium]
MWADNLAPCGALVFGGRDPAVALRFTAGYAHHTPCGVKIPTSVRKHLSPTHHSLNFVPLGTKCW